MVVKWTWDPDIKDHFLVLDHHGKEATLNYAPQNQGRVIAIYSDTAYLSGYDDESGEATIIKCSSDKIDQTINHHPLVYQKRKSFGALLNFEGSPWFLHGLKTVTQYF